MAEVRSAWERVHAVIDEKRPDLVETLAAGIDAEALAAAEDELGFPLPPPLRELYAVHDGAAELPCLFGGRMWFMGAKAAAAHYHDIKEQMEDEAEDGAPWTERFIPFGNEHSYKNLLFVDGDTGTVWHFQERDWSKLGELAAWLENLAKTLAS